MRDEKLRQIEQEHAQRLQNELEVFLHDQLRDFRKSNMSEEWISGYEIGTRHMFRLAMALALR